MTTPTNFYAPHDVNAMETVQYARRAIDEMTRSNPLQNAVVSSGLVRWIGRYLNDSNPDRINFLWIGEFQPTDPDQGGLPQRGFSLVRDDSRGGRSAIAMYDPTPDVGNSGLRQVLIFSSGDGDRLFEESRNGGQRWPEDNVWMGPIGNDTNVWPSTDSASYATVWEGRVNVVGNFLHYRIFGANDTGVSSNHRLRFEGPGGDIVGSVHALGLGASAVFDSTVDVSVARGGTYTVRWETQRTAGAARARSSVISLRCFTP